MEPPDPPPSSPVFARSASPTSTLVAEQGVTVSESPDSFKFRNQDGVWSIAKRCTQSADGRTSTGPGYVFRLTSPLGVTYVNDAVPAQSPTPLDPQFPFGAMNQVFGGLGSFGFHYAHGQAGQLFAGDDPFTTDVETSFPGRDKKVIEGRQCANAPENNGFGVYRSQVKKRPIFNQNGVCQAPCDIDVIVWFRDGSGNTDEGPDDRLDAGSVGDGLVSVLYRYAFRGNEVKALMAVSIYAKANASGRPFVKEPKFAAVVAGGDYTRIVFLRNKQYRKGHMAGAPEGSPLATNNTADDLRNGIRFDYGQVIPATGQPDPPPRGHCDGPRRCLTIEMRGMPVRPNGDIRFGGGPNLWETTGQGLDRWAVLSQTRAKTYANDTSGDSVVWECGAPRLARPYGTDIERALISRGANPSINNVRTWEIGGFKEASTGAINTFPYQRAFAFFNGWFGGRGPEDCEPLQVDFSRPQPSPSAPITPLRIGASAIYTFQKCPVCE